jgi:hypothetical protein
MGEGRHLLVLRRHLESSLRDTRRYCRMREACRYGSCLFKELTSARFAFGKMSAQRGLRLFNSAAFIFAFGICREAIEGKSENWLLDS